MTPYSPKTPPQSPVLFNATPASIMSTARRLIEQSRNVQNQIISNVQPATATFANTMLPLAQSENVMRGEANIIEFYQDVSTDEELRAASREAQSLLQNFGIETSMREDLYKLVEAVLQKNETIDPESRKLLEREHRNFIRNGLGLPTQAMQDRLKEIKKRIARIMNDFHSNINEEDGGLWFTENELDGVPKDTLSGLEKGRGENEGKLRLRFKHPETGATVRHATSSETRKQLNIALANRCNNNVALLKEVVVLRDEAARLLGYPNHAAFSLEESMAKSPDTVNNFLGDLRSRLSPLGLKEVEKLRQVKKADLESRGEQFDGRFCLWDGPFYQRLVSKKNVSSDLEMVSHYFPLSTTVQRMLGIFGKLFGLSFVEIIGKDRDDIAETGKGSEIVWHPDVQLFSVWDDEDDGFLGYLYLDMLTRSSKYANAKAYLLQPGFTDIDGKRRYPTAAVVCNLPQPSSKKPTLLRHRQVWTLFHELGHNIHDLVGKTKYSHFHGANTAEPFNEAPSQMLENWCWIPSVLKLLSQHYSTLSLEYFKAWKEEQVDGDSEAETPPEKIPDDMIKGILETKQDQNVRFYLDQVRFAIFPMTIHQPESHEMAEKMNVSEIWNTLQFDMTRLEGPESEGMGNEWGHGEATFGHFIHGCGYYGYLMSQVYALDMYSTFFKPDLMNGTVGRRYRHMVLEKGGSQDEMKTLVDFLGREPKTDAFYEELGLV